MEYLVLAVLALAAGPAVGSVFRGRAGIIPFLDGFVVLAVPGLIFLHFVPAALEEAALLRLGALALGFMAPILSEKIFKDRHGRTDRTALVLGVTGLALHAALDGAALNGVHGTAGLPFAAAIILHRIPVGLAVWWLAASRLGTRFALGFVLLLMGVTVLGYLGGGTLSALAGAEAVDLYQALVGGSLVHVAFHKSPHLAPGPSTPFARRSEGSGAIVALVLLTGLVLLESGDGHGGGAGFLDRLLILSAESAPALLLAYVFAGILHAFTPSTSIRWMSRGGPLSSASRGMLVGLPLPICSCGVVPLYRTLVQKGASPAAAMAFLVATPELGLDAIFLSIPLLGPQMTVLRLAVAGVAALLVGWWVGGKLKARTVLPLAGEEDGGAQDLGKRSREAVRAGFGEVVDHTAPWIVAGLAVAALAAPVLESGWLGRIPPVVDVLLFALIGFPTYVCASSATPLVATFLATGLSPGAAIAFLITGPATNTTTLGVISGVHGRRVALTFAGTLVAFSVTAGLAINFILGAVPVPSLDQLVEEVPGPVQQVALALLILLFLASVFRRGIRKFAGELRDGLGHGQHGHAHDHPHPSPAGS